MSLGLEKQLPAAAQVKLNSTLGKAGWYLLHTLLWQLSKNTNGLPTLPGSVISSDPSLESFSVLPNQSSYLTLGIRDPRGIVVLSCASPETMCLLLTNDLGLKKKYQLLTQ